MRLYHRLELQGAELLPASGPAIVVINHASLLDVPALMVLDPYPDTATIAKASLFNVPVISWLLRQWGAIPVERQGRDSTGVRALLTVLRNGQVLAVAAEGRSTPAVGSSRINVVLAKIAASAGVPWCPFGTAGSFNALPPGAFCRVRSNSSCAWDSRSCSSAAPTGTRRRSAFGRKSPRCCRPSSAPWISTPLPLRLPEHVSRTYRSTPSPMPLLDHGRRRLA